MSTSLTTNKDLITVTVGSELDTWGPFVNYNTAVCDTVLGGIVTLTASNFTALSTAQLQCNFITFTGELVGHINIMLPLVGSFYTFRNATINSTQFLISIYNSSTAGDYVVLPPGEVVDITADGTNVKFANLDQVGAYLDLATDTLPAWMSAGRPHPYLLCDGSTISSSTYPVLTAMVGGTLPDLRGRTKFMYDPGGVAGSACTTFLFSSGTERVTLSASNMPFSVDTSISPTNFGAAAFFAIKAGTSSGVSNIPPAVVGGITVIRAA